MGTMIAELIRMQDNIRRARVIRRRVPMRLLAGDGAFGL
jgi:hypothetical protein